SVGRLKASSFAGSSWLPRVTRLPLGKQGEGRRPVPGGGSAYTRRMIQFDYSMLLFLMLLAAVVGIWHDNIRVRETANRVAAEACKRRELQMLDGTVALATFRPRFDLRNGLQIERTYVFDYAVDGVLRSTGFIIMLGHAVQHVGLERAEQRG